MKYELVTTTRFRKDVKRLKKQGLPMAELAFVLDQLLSGKELETPYRDHALTGDYIGFRECHIRPDWLLIYLISEKELILTASRTGSHSDLL